MNKPSKKMLKCVQSMIEVASEEIGYKITGGELELVITTMCEPTLKNAFVAVEMWKEYTAKSM